MQGSGSDNGSAQEGEMKCAYRNAMCARSRVKESL